MDEYNPNRVYSEFDKYVLTYDSAPQLTWQASASLYSGDGIVGRVLFMKRGEAMPANLIDDGCPLLHYSVEDFHNIVLVLALDSPLYIWLDPESGMGAISTGKEAIGDLDKS